MEKGVIISDMDDFGENHNFIPDNLSCYKVLRKGQFGMSEQQKIVEYIAKVSDKIATSISLKEREIEKLI